MPPTNVTTSNAERIGYILTYRLTKKLYNMNFQYPSSDLNEAIKKGQEYCRERNVAFVNVEPFFHDLDEFINNKRAKENAPRIEGVVN